MNTSRRQSGITLVEFLVVIGIIGILASILLVAISRAKARASQIQCINNVRQLGIALQGFVAENHAYPLVINPSWVADLQHTELESSNKPKQPGVYLGQGVWHCPSAHRPAGLPSNAGFGSYGYNWYGMSRQNDSNAFGLGGHFVWTESRPPAPAVNESEVASPSEMMAIGDDFIGGNGVVRDGGLALWRTEDVEDYFGSTKRSRARHQGKANVVFCDGHVESPTLKFLFEDTSDEALSRWNRDHQAHRDLLK